MYYMFVNISVISCNFEDHFSKYCNCLVKFVVAKEVATNIDLSNILYVQI